MHTVNHSYECCYKHGTEIYIIQCVFKAGKGLSAAGVACWPVIVFPFAEVV